MGRGSATPMVTDLVLAGDCGFGDLRFLLAGVQGSQEDCRIGRFKTVRGYKDKEVAGTDVWRPLCLFLVRRASRRGVPELDSSASLSLDPSHPAALRAEMSRG